MTISLKSIIRSSVWRHRRLLSEGVGAPNPLSKTIDQGREVVAKPVRRIKRRTVEVSKRAMAPFLTRLRHFLIGKLALSIDALHARLERFEERATNVTRELAEAQSVRNDAVQTSLADLGARIERLEERIANNSRDVAVAQSTREDVIQKLNRLLGRSHIDLDPNTSLIRSSMGYILVPKSDAALTALMVETGAEDYEVGTRKLIGKFAETSTLLIDVGANIGLLTLTMARAVKQGGQVIAVEPSPTLARLLFRTMAINGLSHVVQVRQEAVSNQLGIVNLHLSDVCGHNSLLPFDRSYPHAETRAKVEVPSVRLDDIVPPGTVVDLVKIDVEGAELLVVAGMERIISESPDLAIIVEYGALHLLRANTSAQEWFTTFEDRGFSGYCISDVSGKCEPVVAANMFCSQAANLLFLRPQSRFTKQLC